MKAPFLAPTNLNAHVRLPLRTCNNRRSRDLTYTELNGPKVTKPFM